MFYPFHSQPIILNQQPFDWLGLLNLLAVAFIGWQAYLISKRQADLEDYADVFVRPYKLTTEIWELQIRSACSRIIYIDKIIFEGRKAKEIFGDISFSRKELAILPVGEQNYYSIQLKDPDNLDKDNNGVPTLHFHIEFYDVLKKKRTSHHAGWFQENTWVIHNLKSR